jgi:steroid 5-alpha reductase family enzyme
LRNLKKSEDFRYKQWRDTWGKWFYLRSFFQVYLLQGLLMIVIGYPFIHAAVYGADSQLGILSVLGVAVWCVGYFFEVVSDYQLDVFIKNPANKGAVMDQGLWQYSRHPNYFGEVTMWWGVWLITLPFPFGLYTIVSPLAITFLILNVSGVPLLEKKFAGNPKFEEYKKGPVSSSPCLSAKFKTVKNRLPTHSLQFFAIFIFHFKRLGHKHNSVCFDKGDGHLTIII